MNFYFIWFFIMFFFSLMSFYFSLIFNLNEYFLMIEYKLMSFNSVPFYFVILLDWISLIFMSVVMFISSMVIIYSYNYMGGLNYSSIRFLFLVILFIFSMVLMITSPNLLSILLGWDGLGLVSYCLVIYYNSNKSYLAGLVTCLTNRLGDIGLLICISWMMSYGSWHFMLYLDFFCSSLYNMIIISCFTKSAQIPFSCWLPAAMAAPTPVSSLVHSSTLVTAGVYLLIRFFNFFNFNNYLFMFLSMMTMIMSSLCANYEFDLKKIIALSTLSQLGLMMTSLFLGMMEMSFFHLITHAMFKSLIFLCSGIFIFYMNDNQDIRMMGSVCMSMPVTTSCFNIASMALCGIPFLSGFYSKDLILESSLFLNLNLIVFFMLYLSMGLTMMYSFRLFYYSMIYNNKFISYNLMIDSLNFMILGISLLTFFSIFFGSVIMWIINLDIMLINLPMNLKLLSLLMILMGMWIGLECFNFKNFFNLKYYMFNSYMWYMYSHSFYGYKYSFHLGKSFMFNVCMWGEYYGGMGVSMYMLKLSFFIQNLINNNMKIFMISFLIWFFIMI
uniref:NADH-ubiquinone oxidoreductase chain 5 n=1 Tax=Sophonia fuscomarginata TaxID=3092774 RepID=A0AAF0YYK1_9HEMI|nr:NADH dehydrogenase subunit 5 [Sophonia fuscomarginata]WPC85267.1 NADH dehydrogenase subunit 5 [Sophonia fuscomarginata]